MSERHGAGHGLTDHELSEIRMLIEERTGIHFDDSRERFFSTRVREHVRERGFTRGIELVRAIRKSNVEYEALLEKLLTQETSFFRYPAVFEAFERRVLPELHVKKFWKNPRTLRAWSAGCSTGEEPYSIAITILDTLSFADAWDVEILATDIGRQALKHAERGVYSGRSIASVSITITTLGGELAGKPRSKRRLPGEEPPAQNDQLCANESFLAHVCGAYGFDLLHERADLFFGGAPPRHGSAAV